MQKLIIVAALVACALASPIENIKETFQTVDLTRPSPINPDIPSDPKPEEKVTIIQESDEDSDSNSDEEAKAAALPEKLPGPYVPQSDSLSRSKRADKDSSESEEDSSEEDKSPSQPVKLHPTSSLKKELAARTSTTTAEPSTDSSTSDGTTSDASTSSTTIAPRRPYAPLIHQHNEHRFRPTTEAAADSSDSSSSSSSSSTSTTAVPSVVAASNHPNDKRDIPVPLTRKYHHHDDEEEETKPKTEEPATVDDNAPEEEVKQEKQKDEDHKPAVPASHPALIPRPIPVAELFAKKPTTESTVE